MNRIVTFLVVALMGCATLRAEDHVMAATKPAPKRDVPATLSLSLSEAQDYAVQQNRSLRNAELAVQQAYAQRWQTIASMLPSVDLSFGYTNMFGYKMSFGGGGSDDGAGSGSGIDKYLEGMTPEEVANVGQFMMQNPGVTKLVGNAMSGFGGGGGMEITMPNSSSLGISAAIGLNGQAIVGALLNNVAIDMQKISLEKSEKSIRCNIISSYASVLVMQDVVALLDSSLHNIEQLEQMTQRSVEVGAAEQTTADQIRVRVNALRNNINQNKRMIELAKNSLKVLLDVPAETELTLTTSLDEMLSAEAVLQLLGEDFNIAQNLDYQLLEKNVELAEKNVHMAAWAYGPTVSLAYQHNNQYYYGEGGFRSTPPNLMAVNVSMPLWSSGKRAAGVVDKKIALESARNTLAETSDNLGIQNQQLRYNLQNAYETYLNEKDNMSVTQRVFLSTTNKFHFGASSNLELVNASNDVISAQSTYVQAVLSLINAEIELNKFLNK